MGRKQQGMNLDISNFADKFAFTPDENRRFT